MMGWQTKDPRGDYCESSRLEDFRISASSASPHPQRTGESMSLAEVDELQINVKIGGLEHGDNVLQVVAGLGGNA